MLLGLTPCKCPGLPTVATTGRSGFLVLPGVCVQGSVLARRARDRSLEAADAAPQSQSLQMLAVQFEYRPLV